MPTKADIREAVKFEARVKNQTNLDPLIDTIIAELLYEYCNKFRFQESLVLDNPLTLVTDQGNYALPTDYQNFATLRYSIDGGTVFWEIKPFNQYNRRRFNQGYPTHFILSNNQINLYPFSLTQSSDICLLDYYKDLRLTFTADSDLFPIPRIYDSIKKDTIKRLAYYDADYQEAGAYQQETMKGTASAIDATSI